MSDSTDRHPAVTRKTILIIALVIAAFVVGYYLPQRHPTEVTAVNKVEELHDHSKDKKPAWWTCSMHPQIRLPHPGKCPICFMDLIPLVTEADSGPNTSMTQYTMSEEAMKLAEVETTPVRRQTAKVIIRMVGQVYEDETRQATLTARVDGRLDEMYISFTGVSVNQGDPMVKIWSPTLIKSQVELFETIRSDSDKSLLKGAEEKLKQYGMTQEQIEQIERNRKPDLYVTLRAPISGVVTKKLALLGQFVKEGQDMYMINDFSKVWVKMDAYESDLPWIRYGQDVTFTTPAVPGRTFQGRVLFIDPMLDTKTRSVKVRVEADNPDLILKTGMFVSAELQAEVDAKGRLIKSEWVGKYVCPMHPRDQASSEPGICPDSKMPLRPATSFGYSDEKNPELPLVIPASAPLITGKRSIVYVELPGNRPTFELREVVLGPRAGDYYIVYSGLKEGERVVTKGNFKIDSAMQILAKSSMMAPTEEASGKAPEPKPQEKTEEEVIEKIPAPKEFLESLTPVVKEYLNLKEALVEEKTGDATQFAAKMQDRLKEARRDILNKSAYESWNKYLDSMTKDLRTIAETQEILAQRKAFDPLSETFVKVMMGFRHVMDKPLVVFYCPMAFDQKGAYWVDASEERRNPYFGTKPFKGQNMLTCGELVDKVPPEQAAQATEAGQTAAGEKVSQEKVKPDSKDTAGSPEKSNQDTKAPSTDKSKSESKTSDAKSRESHSDHEGGQK